MTKDRCPHHGPGRSQGPAPDPKPPGPPVSGRISGHVCAHGRQGEGGRKRSGQKFWVPPGVLISSSGCPASIFSLSPPPVSCIPLLLPQFYSFPFPSAPLSFHFSHFFSLPSFCFSPFLADPSYLFISCLSRPLPWPSQSLSPAGPPGALFLVPGSSPSLSPPALHPGGCGPGCHQWRNQRQFLHHVSGWLSGRYAGHLRGW